MKQRSFYEKVIKRTLDIVIASIGIILLLPLYGIVALLVRLKLGSTVLFRQSRPGRNENVFKMLKFRTMTNERGSDGELLPDEARLTGFGKFLRASSLDELPELYNVLKGDISLIGPRPLLVKYLPRYSDNQRRRHLVRPGITGWAQVHGRNSVSWQQKFDYDLYYVDNISFRLDVKILLLTIVKVLKREGINSENAATMEEFMGDSAVSDNNECTVIPELNRIGAEG